MNGNIYLNFGNIISPPRNERKNLSKLSKIQIHELKIVVPDFFCVCNDLLVCVNFVWY